MHEASTPSRCAPDIQEADAMDAGTVERVWHGTKTRSTLRGLLRLALLSSTAHLAHGAFFIQQVQRRWNVNGLPAADFESLSSVAR